MRFLPHIIGGEETRKSLSVSLLLLVLVVSCPLVLNGCFGDGGGGAELTEEEETPVSPTGPAIVSLKDAAGNTIELTGSTGCVPTSFTLTFDQAMDPDSVIRPGHITLLCKDMPSCEITVEQAQTDEEGKEYTVTVEDAYKYQLKECRLTISKDVTAAASSSTSASKALGEDVSFTFTNACAISDDFNADSHGCWTLLESYEFFVEGEGVPVWNDWDTIFADGVLEFKPLQSVVKFDDDTGHGEEDERGFLFYKTVNIEGGFELTMHFRKASGFDAPEDAHQPDEEHARVKDNAWYTITTVEYTSEGPKADSMYVVGLGSFGEVESSRQYCMGLAITPAVPHVMYGMPCEDGKDHYIRLTYTPPYPPDTPGSVILEHSEDGVRYSSKYLEQLFPYLEFHEPVPFLFIEDFSGPGFIALGVGADDVADSGPTNNKVTVDSVMVTGVTCSEQKQY